MRCKMKEKKKIKLSIQEIVNDFYKLGETEGYLSGLASIGELCENDTKSYHEDMVDLIDKYLPNWKEKVNEKYWECKQFDEKGLILSNILYNNFKEIFYALI